MPIRQIKIVGAKEHNLKNVSINIPRDRLVVITGPSGSGKSSLAFDTIHQEGQRRFMESLSSYARQFLGQLSRPKVERISGLSPTICIDQKTVNRNPRSTVGTITECLDHFRLLMARLGKPHCPICDKPLALQSAADITRGLLRDHKGKKLHILAPIIQDRKGEYRKELSQALIDGYIRARIDGQMRNLDEEITLARYEKHTIELVMDRVRAEEKNQNRIIDSVEKALAISQGTVSFLVGEEYMLLSAQRSCPEHGTSAPELEPRLFSFNAPQGLCPACNGLGFHEDFSLSLMIDPKKKVLEAFLPMQENAVLPFTSIDIPLLKKICKRLKIPTGKTWEKTTAAHRELLLYGAPIQYTVKKRAKTITYSWSGLVPTIKRVWRFTHFRKFKQYRTKTQCQACHGARLNPIALAVRFREKNIHDLTQMSIREAKTFIDQLTLSSAEELIARQLLIEMRRRLHFLSELGLDYLSFNRSAATLSGGEGQRIRLAAQVGSGLQGVTYVLDEPSIGLHQQDQANLIKALMALRDKGNSILVVEHDPLMMAAADHLIELGPAAGTEGGMIVASGSAKQFWKSDALTARYLRGELKVPRPEKRRKAGPKWIQLLGASEHNLKQVNLKIPIGVLTVITGVSGSGKSTLIEKTLCRAIEKKLYQKNVIPGAHLQLKGLKHIDKLIKIDQSPIGRTPRSNPATYTKMMLPIRELFSQTLEAKRRGYTKSRFSFNVSGERGGGRCSECEGAGFKTIDMQFLSNVTLPCESCNGNRFNHETLEIRYKGKNIFDVLEMTILEASEFFANQKKIHRTLQLLVDVGLGYVKLGQPSTTLSGGEAQRIKLASELQKKSTGKTLYVLDEPTTGLHMADVARLLEAIQKLVHAGNTIVVIEHDLDLIQAADHIVDLGPKGGLEGGNIVGVGTPEEIAMLDTPTGRALQKSLVQQHKPAKTKPKTRSKKIVLKGASLHNLKNVDVSIPQQSLSIITGPSGSGKTSLAFDTLFAEGQRRYVESLSTYARRFLGRMQRPPLRESSGLAPAIAIDQRNKGHTPRSTVATATELYDLFRLLYARIGKPHCPHCHTQMQAYSPSKAARHLKENAPHAGWLISRLDGDILAGELMQSGYLRCWENESERELHDPKELLHNPQIIIDRLNPTRSSLIRLSDGVQKGYGIGRNQAFFQTKKNGRKFSYARDMRCSVHGKILPEKITPRHFSFNTILGACPRCNGLGRVKEIDLQKLFPKPKKPIWKAIHGWVRASFHSSPKIRALIKALFKAHGLSMSLTFENWPAAFLNELMHGHPHPLSISYKRGTRKYQDTVPFEGLDKMINAWSNDATWLRKEGVCPDCNGQRLKKEITAIKIQGKNISEICEMRIGEALTFWQNLSLTESEQKIAAQVSKELIARLQFLTDVGLSYLQLNRGAKTLSGGESQRIRLASQLGSGLSRSIYVLDEPTIGLHHNDTQKLIHTLKQLRELDNTIVIVEHDESVIRSADYVIDMGPAAGAYGGQIVESGPPQALQKGLTGQYLRGAASIPLRAKTRRPQKWITMPQTDKHNLKSVSPKLPRGLLTAVTGVSGSGKSTLIMEEFAALLEEKCSKKSRSGIQSYQVVTQRPIGKSPRSTPVSYCDIWDPIRELFSSTKEAQSRGWKKRRFSYNTPDGRCVHCEGRGATLVEMHFLSDIWLPCEHCNGTRFNAQTLEIQWSGLSISDVLNLSVSEALQFFQNHKRIYRRLQALSDIGLGYLRLGQPANELSGGEAQRMKIAKFLAKGSRAKETCFLLDEPTTGLHFSDIAKLIKALHALVDAGHMVVLIEHNLDVISRADYIIDMGPEGGENGGRILDVGTPAEIAQRYTQTGSKTGKALYELQNQKTPSG